MIDFLGKHNIGVIHYSGCEDGYDSAVEYIKMVLKEGLK